MAFTDRQREEIKARLRSLRERNGVRTLDPVEPSRGYELAYYREIVRPVNELSTLVKKDLLPLLERTAVENGRFVFADLSLSSAIAEQLKRFSGYSNSFSGFAVNTAERFTRRNDDYHYRKFVSGINKQFGINIADQMSEDRVTPILRKTTKDNVDLIVDLPKKYYEQINKIVYNGLTSGSDFGSLRKQLVQIEGINKRRAKLIAVDQTQKLVGKLNQVRQENEGITRYQWSSRLDARTRDRHIENDGNVYEWSDTNPGKAFGRPGEEVRCRCTGRGVVDEGVLAKHRPTGPARTRDQKDAIIAGRTSFPDLSSLKKTKVASRPVPKLPSTQIERSKEVEAIIVKAERKIANNKRETGILFDEKGEVVYRQKGGKDYVDFTESQAQKMRGGTLIHNHPSGNSFSPQDIKLFTRRRPAEIRAAGSEYTFILSGQIDPSKADEIFEAATALRKKVVDDTWKHLQSESLKKPGLSYSVEGPKYDKKIYNERLTEFFNRYGLKYKRVKTYE